MLCRIAVPHAFKKKYTSSTIFKKILVLLRSGKIENEDKLSVHTCVNKIRQILKTQGGITITEWKNQKKIVRNIMVFNGLK